MFSSKFPTKFLQILSGVPSRISFGVTPVIYLGVFPTGEKFRTEFLSGFLPDFLPELVPGFFPMFHPEASLGVSLGISVRVPSRISPMLLEIV